MFFKGRRQSANVVDIRVSNATTFSIKWELEPTSATSAYLIDTDGLVYLNPGVGGSSSNATIGLIPAQPKPTLDPNNDNWFPSITISQKISIVNLIRSIASSRAGGNMYMNPPNDEIDISITQLGQSILDNLHN